MQNPMFFKIFYIVKSLKFYKIWGRFMGIWGRKVWNCQIIQKCIQMFGLVDERQID